jgi:hypothetical protein
MSQLFETDAAWEQLCHIGVSCFAIMRHRSVLTRWFMPVGEPERRLRRLWCHACRCKAALPALRNQCRRLAEYAGGLIITGRRKAFLVKSIRENQRDRQTGRSQAAARGGAPSLENGQLARHFDEE